MTDRDVRDSAVGPTDIRIAHVSAYSLRQLSGINSVVLSLASVLSTEGIRLSLWCPGDGGANGVVDVVPLRVGASAARNILLATRTFAGLVRNRSRFHLIHAHQPHVQSIAALIAARVLGVPSILTLHVQVPQRRSSQFVNRAVAKLGASLAVEVVAVADRVRRDFGIQRCTVIPNGVSISESEDEREPVPPPPSPGGARLDLVFAGRVTETKGVFVLLQALAHVKSRVKRVRLTTYGDIDAPKEYEAAKRALDVHDFIEDRNFQEEWRENLRAGQVFVLPSFYEGMPVAMLEAMAAGLPVVATPVGGIPEVVHDNVTGLLVSVGDVVKLSEALVWLAERPEEALAMGREARRLVETRYSDRRMAASYARLYASLIGRRR